MCGLFLNPNHISYKRRTMEKTTTKKGAFNVRALAITAMLAALSYVLAFLEIPVPLSPSFAKFDLSDLPALMGAFAFGPVSGVAIELIKNALHLITTSTGGIGELANFICGGSFVLSAGLIYGIKRTKKNAWIACLISSLIMGIAAAVTNYFILLPMFEQFMPLDQIIESFGAFIPFIKTKFDVVAYNALPFNVLKGLAIGVFTMLVYKRLMPVLRGSKETAE